MTEPGGFGPSAPGRNDTRDDPTSSAGPSEDDNVAYAWRFLQTVARLRGVRIDRADFLRAELRKLGASNAAVSAALASTPVQAGIRLVDLDDLALKTIRFETRKSSAASFAAGLPGGFALAGTVPADVAQYYVHAFRVMQKLAYLYGWQEFLSDVEDADDETVGRLAAFLGVMLGVVGASKTLTTFAANIAAPAVQRQIAAKALTKTAWYPPLKSTLKLVGVKLTRDSFAKTVSKAVPLVGGVVSGSMTLLSLDGQAKRLMAHLRELPPPNVDAAAYAAGVREADEAHPDVARSMGTAIVEGVPGAARAGESAHKAIQRLKPLVRKSSADRRAVASAAEENPDG